MNEEYIQSLLDRYNVVIEGDDSEGEVDTEVSR